ncbi:MAG: malto-oligosyltrehalose trehalohydrolase, partial [Candidatus Heimdallarchaeota archaeon]|nr:malto-oligosyltrehalose trehalohydrolase [Candidatus Heimdallarchaeota archaeon]
MKVGAHYIGGNKCEFTVWATFVENVSVCVNSPDKRLIPLEKLDKGYWHVCADNISPGTQYYYQLNDSKKLPDPASFYQPEGVHGVSEVVDHKNFVWDDAGWDGINLSEMILYELHIGTFTPEGTFQAVISKLDDLKDIGINTIEIMPIAQFPGERNWGYDGAYPYAVQNSYGGPTGLKSLVDAAHQKGISVILDVVYNHLGPEGNYLSEFAPYFTDNYKTPWGNAINFDDRYCYGVRNYFIGNMLSWFDNYHIDGLRLDAIHSIFDRGAKHILEELADHAALISRRLGRKHYLIAESDLNDSRIIKSKDKGGYGIDAQWCDDYHHLVHTLLTQERSGYYDDFQDISQIENALGGGFVYTGQYSDFRKRNFGGSSKEIQESQLIVFSQNHDQIGNRKRG